MVKQFKLKLKEEHKDSEQKPQWTSYSGEPLDKFKARVKKEDPKFNFDMYELDNSDVEIDEEGLIILGKIMKLWDEFRPHVKVKDIKYIVGDKMGQLAGGVSGSAATESEESEG